MLTVRALSQALITLVAETVSLSTEQVAAAGVTVSLLDPSSPHNADLTTNAAMMLARTLGKPPRAVAELLVGALITHARFASVTIAGPGFINITLTPAAWAALAAGIQDDAHSFFKAEAAASPPSSYLIEYVSANPTGPLHLGHGRNAIIGDVLARALRFAGHRVATEFYINDAGSQMQKLGASLKARCLEALGKTAQIPEEGYHGDYLIDIAEQCLSEHTEAVTEKDISFFTNYAKKKLISQQQEELTDYGVTLDSWFSELSLHESGAIDRALAELDRRGFLYTHEGALWFKSTAFGDDKDRVIRKADGTLTYIAPDIAYHVDKFSRGYHTLIDIVGQDHHGYVLRLKGTLTALGFDPQRLDVLLYQLVSLKQGEAPVRMSKRSGNFIGLREVIDTVGVDAARFFFLHKKADAHLELDIDAALKQSQENPIFYLHYAYVRTISILQKAAEAGLAPRDITEDDCFAKEDIVVIKKALGLGMAIHTVATQYATHVLAHYALDLAQVFHAFYTNNKVIDLANPAISKRRLAVVRLTRATLAVALELLGLNKRESM